MQNFLIFITFQLHMHIVCSLKIVKLTTSVHNSTNIKLYDGIPEEWRNRNSIKNNSQNSFFFVTL